MDRPSFHRALGFALAVLLGLVAGAAAGWLATAFVPECGDPCGENKLLVWTAWSAGAVVLFVAAAQTVLPRNWAGNRLAGGAALLFALVLAPALAQYVVSLQTEYQRLEVLAPVQPSVDFSNMAIATRAVNVRHGDAAVVVPAWQRCAVGSAHCEQKPRQVEMQCKRGIVRVDEAEWPAFTLIPQEDLAGVSPLASTRFCER